MLQSIDGASRGASRTEGVGRVLESVDQVAGVYPRLRSFDEAVARRLSTCSAFTGVCGFVESVAVRFLARVRRTRSVFK